MTNQLITIDDVKKIAQLSQLEIAGEEEKFTKLFQDTLDYIQVLNELDTSKTKETYQVTGLSNVFQKDGENTVTLSQDDALQNAKNNGNEINYLFGTKAVLER
jgi:aspartyl/glutamyl-tRNA(Asn/Gln) amidotransferase C subunit